MNYSTDSSSLLIKIFMKSHINENFYESYDYISKEVSLKKCKIKNVLNELKRNKVDVDFFEIMGIFFCKAEMPIPEDRKEQKK